MDLLPRLLVGLFDPRKILFAAVLVAAAGLVAGYADVQERADRELALRQGPPPPVVIQDFRPGADEGPACEVRLHGEIDMEAAVVLPRRGTSPREWVLVAPVHPVSDLGAALLAGGSADAEGVLAAQAERRAADEPLFAPAIGLIVAPVPGPETEPVTPEMLAEAVLGQGDHGTLVTLGGLTFEPGPLTLMGHGALAAKGVLLSESFVAIKPFMSGREAALTAALPREQTYELFVVALALVGLAGLLHLWNAIRADTGAALDADDDDDEEIDFVPPPPSENPKFAPLPSQGEIRAADRVAARKMAPVLPDCTFLCRIAQGISRRLFGRVRATAVRSPQSRPEDEAL